jgi:hypothetical protein
VLHHAETTSTRSQQRSQHQLLHGHRALSHQGTSLGRRGNTTSAPDEELRTKRARLGRAWPEENVRRGRENAKVARRFGL